MKEVFIDKTFTGDKLEIVTASAAICENYAKQGL